MSAVLREALLGATPQVSARPGQQVATLLVTVKAYPAIGTKTGEAVCVAGVRIDTADARWMRLFPVGFRALPAHKQFDKYQVIRLRVAPANTDRRPESLRPDLDSMQLGPAVGTSDGWRQRTALMRPLIGATTTCALLAGVRERQSAAPSLGLIKPSIEDLTVIPNPDYVPRRSEPSQMDLFGQEMSPLEVSPVIATFRYRCQEPGCRGHNQSLVDWESGQLARRNRAKGDTAMARLHRERFLDQMCDPSRDPHFFVGNMHQHLENFLVLGIWTAPATTGAQLELDL